MAVDDFTKQHLRLYVEFAMEYDEGEAFEQWALEEIERDPVLIDYGWSTLLTTWRNDLNAKGGPL